MKLEITTNIGCVNHCKVCPQSALLDAYDGQRQLSFEDLMLVLECIPQYAELVWCGFSEPFLNPTAASMMAAAYAYGFHQRVCTTFVGFTEKQALSLKTANVHYFKIHVPDLLNFVFPSKQWIDLHQRFWDLQIAADYDYMAMGTVPDEIQSYLSGIGINRIKLPTMISRAGNAADRPCSTGNLWCQDNRWHYNVMLPNGDVYLCCMDWGLKHKLGNLLNQPYFEIWQQAERLRLADHSQLICAKCEVGVQGTWYNPFGRPKL